MEQVQCISDENKKVTGVIVPIDLWKEIKPEKETAYLLKSETMKRRLLEAKNRIICNFSFNKGRCKNG